MTETLDGEMDSAERDKLMGQAYTQAQSDLRRAHQDEFNGFYQKRCAEKGIEWTPRLSKTDKALADTLKLVDADPKLAERLAMALAEKLGATTT